MRKVSALLLSVLAISLFVSLGSVQPVSAAPGCKVRHFWYTVYAVDGTATSSVEWLTEPPPNPPFTGALPISWWGEPPWPPGPPVVEEYWIDDELYVCHGDWCMVHPIYEGNFRYRWWIFWESKDAAMEPGAKSLGGFFIFSHGSGDFQGMYAFGKAWVEMLPGQYYPVGYQYHVGLMFGGPK